METNFRRALMGEGGDPTIFVTSPISAGMLAVAALVVFVPLFRMLSVRIRSGIATNN
jgi:TctA family transporter